MTEAPSRDVVIELLEKLGSDRDEDVLEAARQVHARITAAGMTWEDLLVSEGGAAETDDTGDEIDEAAEDDVDTGDEIDEAVETGDEIDDDSDDIDDDELPEAAGAAGAKHADSMALIAELLAKSDISADMREELKGYKTDIAAGEFDTRDRRYLSAVHKRLSKRR